MNMLNPALRRASIFSLLLPLLLLPGCFKLSRGTPVQQHFVLGTALEHRPSEEPRTADSLMVGIRPPRLADYLSSPFVVIRRGANRIEFSDLDRWGEDLSRGIGRSLAREMAVLAPSSRFESAPWPQGTKVEQIVQLEIHRFEGVVPEGDGMEEGEAHLLASWEILRSSDGVVLSNGVTEVRTPGWDVEDVPGLVALLDAGLGVLATDILDAIVALPPGARTTVLP